MIHMKAAVRIACGVVAAEDALETVPVQNPEAKP